MKWQQWEGLLLFAMVSLAGCGKHSNPLPATYPVHGKITHADGTPVVDGTVQFQPQAEPSVTTCAEIGKDGKYSLTTMRNGVQSEGALVGPNRVLVVTIGHDKQGDFPFLTKYPTPYSVEPQDNEINLTVERPRR